MTHLYPWLISKLTEASPSVVSPRLLPQCLIEPAHTAVCPPLGDLLLILSLFAELPKEWLLLEVSPLVKSGRSGPKTQIYLWG